MTPAWRVAAALALACGLDWGRWAAGLTAEPEPRTIDPWTTMPCDACGCEHQATRSRTKIARVFLCGACEAVGATGWTATPVADPSDVDAYLDDCARRGVEPGPLPSLSWTSDDGRVKWSVDGPPTYVLVRVAAVALEYADGIAGRGWYPVACRSFGVASDWYGAATLVTAAAAALEHDHG